MAAGDKCKYLLYIANVVAADALANRRRHAWNCVHVLCLSEEGDQLWMRLTSLIKSTKSTGARSTPAVFKRQEGHDGTTRHVYHGYKNLV